MLALLGAELVLTPAPARHERRHRAANEILAATPGSVMPGQFDNPANPDIHRKTAAEIWNDTKGAVDFVVAGVGTGGTITGVGQVLKAKKPSLRMIAVEPENSPVLSGGAPGPHKIQGIGAGFVPAIVDRAIIDEIVPIGNQTAFDTARLVARLEGLRSAFPQAPRWPPRSTSAAARRIALVLPRAYLRWRPNRSGIRSLKYRLFFLSPSA